MTRTLIDNLPALSWTSEDGGFLDSPNEGPQKAYCPLTRMSFRLVEGKHLVRGAFTGPEGRTEGTWKDMEAAQAAASLSRIEEIKRLMTPSQNVSLAPLVWERAPEGEGVLTSTCPVTRATFRITGTHEGYAGQIRHFKGAKTQVLPPAPSPNDLRDRFEAWRRERVLPHIVTGSAPALPDLGADQDPVVWATRDGQELRMSEIEDSHLSNIVTYLTARCDAAKWDAQVAGGTFLTSLNASIEKMDAQLGMFSAEAKRRGIEVEDPDDVEDPDEISFSP